MKIKTSDLEGSALDWSVAKAVKWPAEISRAFSGIYLRNCASLGEAYSPSTDWSQGGALIDRNHVCVNIESENLWSADSCHSDGEYRKDALGRYKHESMGPTPLIAACRAIVAAKLGDEVEVPDELL